MVPTSIPVSHNGFLQNTYGGSSQPSCFLGFLGPGCSVDPTHFVGVQGLSGIGSDIGDSFVNSAKGIKDFTASGDKIALLLPFIVLMLAFGLAIGWSKGHRYFA